jgi:hypothetical protein
VSVPTAELPATAIPATGAPRLSPLSNRLGDAGPYVALGFVALVIAALSLLLPSTPSYDPWAWLVWGREIVHLDLHTNGGPTWKPLPVIFTTVFAPFGKAAPDMWLIVGRAGGVLAAGMTFKVAARFAHQLAGADRRSSVGPVLLAGAIAAGMLVFGRGFISDSAYGYSEGLMTALVLIAVDRHLDGARRQAFAVGFAAVLDRPELCLLWGPYGLYLWWRDPGARKLVIGLFALFPVLWFLPEYWGSGHLFRGVNRAHHPRANSPAFAKCPFCTELAKHAWPTVIRRITLAAVVGVLIAAALLWRERKSWWRGWPGRPSWRALIAGRQPSPGSSERALTPAQHGRVGLLLVAALGAGWWLLIAILTQAGFSGNDRYLVLGAALVSIAGGVSWAWLAVGFGRLAAGLLGRLGGGGLAARFKPAALAVAATAVATALFLAVPPWVGGQVVDVQRTHRAAVYQAHLRQDLTKAVSVVGGPAAVRRCGTVMTEGFQVPMLAWTLGVHTDRVWASPPDSHNPGPPPDVIFQTRAQRHAHLLPFVRSWTTAHYRRVAHVRTFNVYVNSTCNLGR